MKRAILSLCALGVLCGLAFSLRAWTTNPPVNREIVWWSNPPAYVEAMFGTNTSGVITNVVAANFYWTNRAMPTSNSAFVLQIALTNGSWTEFGRHTVTGYVTNSAADIDFTGTFSAVGPTSLRTRVRYLWTNILATPWSNGLTNTLYAP